MIRQVRKQPPQTKRSIRWRLHLRSSPNTVFDALTTDSGRERFWAESSNESNGVVHFTFADESKLDARIIEATRPRRFVIEYFGGSIVAFDLKSDDRGGTDLALFAQKVKYYEEELPGWVSVLMSLKGAVDFGVDLRNHDHSRTWDGGYLDN